MQPVIYADVLIFLNVVITFFLLLTVKQFTGVKTTTARMIAGAVVGGVYSLIVLAPHLPFLLMLLAKTAMSLSITFISFRERRMKKMLQCFVLFWTVSFLYAGIMFALQLLVKGQRITVNNGTVYFDINIFALIFITVVIYFVIWFLRRKVFRYDQMDMICDIELHYCGNTVKAKALLDSGNHVRDIYSNYPVVILTSAFAERLTTQPIHCETSSVLNAGTHGIPLRLLPVQALTGEVYLPAFTADSAEVFTDRRQRKHGSVCVAVTDDQLGSEKYQALIGEDFI